MPVLMSELAGLRDLADAYDVFLVDQFGVLHDGVKPYAGTPEALMALKAAGKTILLLSNSGKRSAPNEARLRQLGFPQGSWDHFLSSGEVAWSILERQGGQRCKCLLIARDGDRSAIEGLPLDVVEDGRDADVVLISGSEAERIELDHYRELLRPAAERAVPAYCTNPDKIMLTAVGPRPGAGHIAEIYEEMDGPVHWIGKPYGDIYEAAWTMLGQPARERVLCVGDSIEHDIAGGTHAGFATALVATGILASMNAAERESLFAEHNVRPDFLLPGFVW